MVPVVACTRPSRHLIMVVFPEPLGPITETVSPGSKRALKPRSAQSLPYFLPTFSNIARAMRCSHQGFVILQPSGGHRGHQALSLVQQLGEQAPGKHYGI